MTTRETLGAYTTDPNLLTSGDWVYPTVHPYFASVTDPDAACAWTVARYQELRALVPREIPVVIAETGLPTAGDGGLSEIAQAAFFACLEDSDVLFVFFEGYDQSWKTSLPVEPHWGLFRANGTPKAWAIAQAPPAITIRKVRNGKSSFGTPNGWIRGSIENATARSFRVAAYIRTDRWYVQPFLGSTQGLRRRRKWKAPIRFGLEFAALLVAADYVPESPLNDLPVVDGVEVFAIDRR